MQCSTCGKTGSVTIGDKNYCANCGAVANYSSTPVAGAPVAQAAPIEPKKGLFNWGKKDASQPSAPPANVAHATLTGQTKPAQQFHGTNPSTVLDLRGATPIPVKPTVVNVPVAAPAPEVAAPPMPTPAPSATSFSEPLAIPVPPAAEVKAETPVQAPIVPVPSFSVDIDPSATADLNTPADLATPEPDPVPTPETVTETPVSSLPHAIKKEARLNNAASTARSELISKFTPTPTHMPGATIMPGEPALTPAIPTEARIEPPTPGPDPVPVTISAPVAPPLPAAPPIKPDSALSLPNHVTAQINNHSKLAPVAAVTKAEISAALDTKPAKRKGKIASTMAATVAIAIMGGYVWFENYPKLIVKTAGDKAGLQANLPSYIPSSYSLSGPVAYSPGHVTISLKSNGGDGPLVIDQRRTSWDSGSLLDNYVSRKSEQYTTVQSQGLTIYFYNGNQASWVNRGVWYSIEGENRLNREQVLKIAYSL